MDTNTKFSKIYGLSDKKTGEIIYIGKSDNPEKRIKQHIYDSKRRNTKLHQWIRKNPDSLKLVILACAISQDWQSLEQTLISQHKLSGKLLNISKGGNQPSRDDSDPLKKKVWLIKKYIRKLLNEWKNMPSTERIEEKKAILRYAAWKKPELFGEYKNI